MNGGCYLKGVNDLEIRMHIISQLCGSKRGLRSTRTVLFLDGFKWRCFYALRVVIGGCDKWLGYAVMVICARAPVRLRGHPQTDW